MNRTEAKVKAVNRANAYAVELYDKLATVFAPFVGQQVTKKDGGMMAKVEKFMPELPCTPALHVYRYGSEYNLCFVVKTSEIDGNFAVYHETNVYIAELQKGILTKISDRPNHLRNDWTEEEVTKGRQRIKEAKNALSEAEYAIYPFGEYDR